MKQKIIKIAKDLEQGTITTKTARTLLLGLFGVSGSALLNELIPLLISYFYPTTPTSNSDEIFKKRLQIIEILNDFKPD